MQAVALRSLLEVIGCRERDVTSALAARTHVLCHTPPLARLRLFLLKSPESFGEGGWMLAIQGPLCFPFCECLKTAAQIPRLLGKYDISRQAAG